MLNRFYAQHTKGIFQAFILFLIFFTWLPSSKASIIINDNFVSPASYQAGVVNQYAITIDLSNTGGEYTDYIIFEFPSNWSTQFDNAISNPEANACGNAVYTSNGSNILSVGVDELFGTPVGGSSCGIFESGSYTFYINAIVPTSESGSQNINTRVIGDNPAQPTNITSQVILNQQTCILICPEPITVNADDNSCSAFVNIPLPQMTGTCSSAPINQSGNYNIGEHQVTFYANGNNVQSSCTTTVTVIDSEGPSFNNCFDILDNLKGGQCGKVVTFNVNASDNCGNASFKTSDVAQPYIFEEGYNCSSNSTSYYKVFDFSNFTTNIELSAIEFGIYQSNATAIATLKLHELNGNLQQSNLELIQETNQLIPSQNLDVYAVPFFASLESGKIYVVEIVLPPSSVSGLTIATSSNGSTSPSYIKAPACGISQISPLNSQGFPPNFSHIINLIGIQKGINVEQVAGLSSGSEFPIGITTNEFLATDKFGNSASCSFDVEIIAFQDTTTKLACNESVNVSLDGNCEGIITPDMVLEGNQYACYDDYSLIIKDLHGNSYGSYITSDMIDKELIVEVHQNNGNYCWGKVVIEDKLGPQLNCGTIITQCDQDITPGADIAQSIRIPFNPNTIISDENSSVTDIPLNISTFQGATLKDLNVELNVTHDNINELEFQLISPTGTQVQLYSSPSVNCEGFNSLSLTFDSETSNSYSNLMSACNSSPTLSLEGSFQPSESLNYFNNETIGGTWVLRVFDYSYGNGGVINTVLLEIEHYNGVITLPIPETASYSEYGQNTFLIIGLDPCSPTILSYNDVVENMDCTSDYTKIIYRNYTATDEAGNEAMSCTDTIKVLRTDLATLKFPPNYDDIELNSFSCESEYPLPDISGSPTGAFCDNVEMTYEDLTIPICEGSYKILREWTILEWCNAVEVQHTQIITVMDRTAPEIICPQIYAPISTTTNSCDGVISLPVPTISDNCTTLPIYEVSTSSGNITQQNNKYIITGLAPGSHIITYTASDDCGNISSCDMEVLVQDLIPPTPVCEHHTIVSLTFEPTAEVLAYSLDDGSYDDCSSIKYEARRMTTNCDSITSTNEYSEVIVFCCEDIGTEQMVEFKVTDQSGNSNTCMVEVTVVDKLAPAIQVPEDITIECHDPYDDPNLTGGWAIAYDNCDVDLTYYDEVAVGACGEGTIKRRWFAQDPSGNSTHLTQTITLVNSNPFDEQDITWPDNVTIEICGNAATHPDSTGRPILNDHICSEVSTTYQDDVFTVVGDACVQILRTWTVIDDCAYNLNNPQLGEGWWKHIQVINIINTEGPTFQSCEDVTIDVFGDCEGEVSHSLTAFDDCTNSNNLDYQYKIDLYNTNDGIFEFEGKSNNWNYTLPIGKHRIIWQVSDKCGNVSSCEYFIYVRDGKAPTPYCISSLSTAVMSVVGTVDIWATDFDLGAFDNCTASEDLIFSFEKDSLVTSLTFDCDDIVGGVSHTIELTVWVFDEAGNQDHCTVTIKVEDNEANVCDNSGSIQVKGEVADMEDSHLTDVEISATDPFSTVQTVATDLQGQYSFSLAPGTNFAITAHKEDSYLNGVTTLDIALIQKHILQIGKFSDPFQIIAADVNDDHKVTGTDIILLRKLILGYYEELPNSESWRFAVKNQSFPNPAKPFPYDQKINTEVNSSANLDADFVAIKVGDVNHTASANVAQGHETQVRSSQIIHLYHEEIEFKAGEEFEITINAENFIDMMTYQTTFEFNPNIVQFLDFVNSDLNLIPENFNFTKAEEGKFTNLWFDVYGKTIKNNIFTLKFKALQDGSTKDMLHTSSSITTNVAYDLNDNEYTLEMSSIVNSQDIELAQSMIVTQNSPNPFIDETTIGLYLPAHDEVTIRIYNADGRTILSETNKFAAGNSIIQVRKKDLGSDGVYYYTLTGKFGTHTAKMILIK